MKVKVKGQTFLIKEYLRKYGLNMNVTKRCWMGEFSRLKASRIKNRIEELAAKRGIKVRCEIEE